MYAEMHMKDDNDFMSTNKALLSTYSAWYGSGCSCEY